jgi:hypothetical protein
MVCATGLALVVLGLDPGGASAVTPKATPHPIGYIYTTTPLGTIDQFAVQPDRTLKLVGSVTAPTTHVVGLALLHTPGGMHLYALTFDSDVQTIVQYSVAAATGTLTRDKVPPVTGVHGVHAAREMLAFDGYGTDGSGPSAIYLLGCITKACTKSGFAEYRANPQTGKLSLDGTVGPAVINSMSISGTRIDALVQNTKVFQTDVKAILINPKTGDLSSGAPFGLTADNDLTVKVSSDETIATSATSVATLIPHYANGFPVGEDVAVYPSTGRDLTTGEYTVVSNAISGVNVLGFIPHALVAGAQGKQAAGPGPELELFSPDGATAAGTIDLTKPPFNLPTGSSEEPNTVASIFVLGDGVYIGSVNGPIVQGTDGVGGKGLEFNKTHPTVAGSESAQEMVGYLIPPKTTTTVAVGKASGELHITGSVTGGIAGLPVSVTLYRRTGKLFHPIASKSALLLQTKHYSTSFAGLKGAVCRVTTRYTGDDHSGPSEASKNFAC